LLVKAAEIKNVFFEL